jgi:hypothetical protein
VDELRSEEKGLLVVAVIHTAYILDRDGACDVLASIR